MSPETISTKSRGEYRPEERKHIKYRTEYVQRKRFSTRQLQIAAIILVVVVISILLGVVLIAL